MNDVRLDYNKDQEQIMTVTATNPSGMEIVLFKAGDKGPVLETFHCDAEGKESCSGNIKTAISGYKDFAFKILVVGVDTTGTVTGSKVLDFESKLFNHFTG